MWLLKYRNQFRKFQKEKRDGHRAGWDGGHLSLEGGRTAKRGGGEGRWGSEAGAVRGLLEGGQKDFHALRALVRSLGDPSCFIFS